MDTWKGQPRRSSDKEKVREGENQGRKDSGVQKKVRTSRNTVFSTVCGSGRSKSRLAKAAGAETSGHMKDENLHSVWREAHRSTFE